MITATNHAHTVAVIPARGGSKGVPLKNIKGLAGHPLISYTIQSALNAGNIDRVIVSTDSERIAEIAREYGADVPFLRLPEHSGDKALVGAAVQYTLKKLYGEDFNSICQITLYPTSPFRSAKLVRFLTDKLHQGHSQVSTVKRMNDTDNFFLCTNRGCLPISYSPSYALHKHYGVFSGRGLGVDRRYVHVLKEPVSWVDIDTPDDFALAEAIISKGLFSWEADILDR
ncbi:acylneuraminate cytidylyltransferase family protein [Pseudodesulfovibrio sp.]|nr:acylneuraminate cytidylyltransferase family protein [Pseudodesulfovibrio sp.]